MSATLVSRSSPVPMWHQIELALERDMASGILQPNARLPSEASIAQRFGVHRHTARRALASLADKGAVRIRRGLGTFVGDGILTYPISDRTRFTASLQQQNREASHDVLETVEQAADADTARALGLAPATAVTMIRTVGFADAVPVSLARTWFSAERFPGLGDLFRELRSITTVLASFGVADYRRATTRIMAAMPTDEELEHLRQTRREPVLAVESVDVDLTGRPISFGRTSFAGERVQLLVGEG